jgi:hypothetical protein
VLTTYKKAQNNLKKEQEEINKQNEHKKAIDNLNL